MRHLRDLPSRTGFFRVLATARTAQVATMVLRPGQTSGEYGTDHPRSDQVLYVLSGEATVVVRGRRRTARPGDAVLIEAGEPHQVRNEGRRVLRTLNVYAPAAY